MVIVIDYECIVHLRISDSLKRGSECSSGSQQQGKKKKPQTTYEACKYNLITFLHAANTRWTVYEVIFFAC